jgi:hypothetical protein
MKPQETAAGATYLKRYEQKYVLTGDQYQEVTEFLGGRFYPDTYGKSLIYSSYYDTSDYRIIRNAFTRSGYREKLRLRSYGTPETGDTVYVELKKKYQGITYKRRFPVSFAISSTPPLPPPEKRGLYEEFTWFYRRYDLSPAFVIRYDRLALRCVDNPLIRITFDTNIYFRRVGFTEKLECPRWAPILPESRYLMELKTVNAVPLDLSHGLSRAGVFPVSFSKSKTAYQIMIKPDNDSRRMGNTLKETIA